MTHDDPRHYWDNAAPSFDQEPDHGLRDTHVRQAWTNLLKTWLPAPTTTILDVGCGTGSLSVILAELGHSVTAIDFSPAMIAQAQTKATTPGYAIAFHVMDAASPHFDPQSFDVILCRHLLWIFEDPSQVLQRWIDLLKPGGRLMLIEGFWSTGSGLHADDLLAALPPTVTTVACQNLSDQPIYWGKPVTDERYIVIANKHS